VDLLLHNEREPCVMLDSDPIVKIMNALDGDVIKHRRIMWADSTYEEYQYRKVKSGVIDLKVICPSGLSDNRAKTTAGPSPDSELRAAVGTSV
jgi:hypothetical protein